MISIQSIKFDRRVADVLRVKVEQWKLEVGVLQDGPHFQAASKKTTKSYAGGPIRNTTSRENGTIGDVSKAVREFLGFNYLIKPFESSANKEIVRFAEAFLKQVMSSAPNRRQVENLLQAIVRNPILRGDYGRNSSAWAKVKGFNRKLIDTGQLFKGITAEMKGKNV